MTTKNKVDYLILLIYSSAGGLVKVGVVGKEPFISYQLASNVEINYVGISTGNKDWGTTGTWKFCGYFCK